MNKEPFIATVVLNYKTYQDAIECVNSLLEMDYAQHRIIVVDNGSGNASAAELRKAFGYCPMVTLLESPDNLGFAQGNNLGIRYARTEYHADYVFVLNSDTIVPKTLFRDIVKENRSKVGVISPQVVNLNGEKLEPSENSDDILKRAYAQVKAVRLAKVLTMPGIQQLYAAYRKIKFKAPETENHTCGQYRRYVLQGCSYFLTPEFFQYYRNIFPETFLYWEEIDLLMLLHKVGLESICIETEPVIHKVAKTTGVMFGAAKYERRKIQFSFESMKKSIPMFKLSYDEVKAMYDV